MKASDMIRQMAVAVSAMVAIGVHADITPTVTIQSATQRWPWNNKLDITYRVENGQDLANGVYHKMQFTLVANGQTNRLDGSRDMIATAGTGTHTVTCDLPSGIKATNCELTASIYATTGYYMIVDLETGNYAFDGLEGSDTPTARPASSNARYNTDAYKTRYMVLRKVPRTAAADSTYAAGYVTGGNGYESNNIRTNWITSADYFIGIFPVTQAQYKLMMGAYCGYKDAEDGNPVEYRPVSVINWGTLHNSGSPRSALGMNSGSASFFERLNARTGMIGFDLPTEIMFEIALRANTTTKYYWGTDYYAFETYEVWNRLNKPYKVGSKQSNNWGLYDMACNVEEWCLDDASRGQLADAANVFDPAYTQGTTSYRTRGGSVNIVSSDLLASAYRRSENSGYWDRGFRVSWHFQ